MTPRTSNRPLNFPRIQRAIIFEYCLLKSAMLDKESSVELKQQTVALLSALIVIQSVQGGDQHGYQRNSFGPAHQA